MRIAVSTASDQLGCVHFRLESTNARSYTSLIALTQYRTPGTAIPSAGDEMKTSERKAEPAPVAPAEDDDSFDDVLAKILPYWRVIAGAAVLGLTAMVLVNFLLSSQRKAKEAGWQELMNATASGDAMALQAVADSRSGSEVSVWAQQAAAQAKLIEGTTAIGIDRDSAKLSIDEAITGFEKALAQAGNYELIRQRSTWGLAQAYESKKDLDNAKKYYQQVIADWPETKMAEQAKRRIDSLDDPSTKEFYEWYFAQSPTNNTLPESSKVPFSVPTEPDVAIPSPGTEEMSATEDESSAEIVVAETVDTEAGDDEAVATDPVDSAE